MGSVLSARLLDRTLAAICCRRRSGLTAMLLRLDGDGDLRQQEGFFAWRLLRTIRLQGARGP